MRRLAPLLALLLLDALVPTTVAANGGGPGHGGPPPHGGGMRPPRIDDNAIRLETNSFVAHIIKDRAEVVFGYPETHEPPFHLHFKKLIGYNDTGEEGYQRHEALYKADLNKDWTMGQIVEGENEIYGPFVKFNMSLDLTMIEVAAKQKTQDWGVLTLFFTLATNGFNESLDSGVTYAVQGSSELKIDIDIQIHKQLPLQALALEQMIIDQPPPQEQERQFHMEERHRQQRLAPGFNDSNDHRFKDRPEGHQHIGMVNSQELEEGFYNWVSQAEISRGEATELENVTATYATDGNGLQLYLSYPLAANVSSIFHDPSVGVVAANLPSIVVEAARDFVALLLSYGLGGLLAMGAIVAATVIAARKSNGGDMEK